MKKNVERKTRKLWRGRGREGEEERERGREMAQRGTAKQSKLVSRRKNNKKKNK